MGGRGGWPRRWGVSMEGLDARVMFNTSIQHHQFNLEMQWFDSTGQMLSKLSTQRHARTKLMELN
jgi:hypothetical protein